MKPRATALPCSVNLALERRWEDLRVQTGEKEKKHSRAYTFPVYTMCVYTDRGRKRERERERGTRLVFQSFPTSGKNSQSVLSYNVANLGSFNESKEKVGGRPYRRARLISSLLKVGGGGGKWCNVLKHLIAGLPPILPRRLLASFLLFWITSRPE